MPTKELIYSVVVPVYNSVEILPELYERLTKVMTHLAASENYEIVFVDDASTIDCWSTLCDLVAKDCHVRAIQLMKNSGQGLATIAGIVTARGRWIVTIDDDLQHPPEAIPRLVKELVNHPMCDVVIGTARQRRYGWHRRLGSRAIDRMNTLLLKKPSDLQFSGFRVLRREVGQALRSVHLPSPALGPLLLSVTRNIRNVDFDHQSRISGRSNYTFTRILQQTFGNMIGFSVFPLRVLAVFGSIGILLSMLIFLVILIQYVLVGSGVPGFTTLVLLVSSLTGFSFFAFGIIGEYLIRILSSTAVTPPFLIRHEVGGVAPTSTTLSSPLDNKNVNLSEVANDH